MANKTVCTYEYEIDLNKCFFSHLERHGWSLSFRGNGNSLNIEIASCFEARMLASLLAEILLIDIRNIEMKKMASRLAESADSAADMIRIAAGNADRFVYFPSVAEKIEEYLKEHSALVLEGFLRFMLPEIIETWQACIDASLDEIMLRDEYLELVRLLGAFISEPNDHVRCVNLILQPDGSCVLTDENDLRIECSPGCEKSILDTLADISPERITVYDLSMGRFNDFKESLKSMFGGRIEVYS